MSAGEPSVPEIHLHELQILKKLGAGRSGAVYLARQKESRRLVALKVLFRKWKDDSILRERFYRETDILSKLDHPYLVRLLGIGESKNLPYFVMEYEQAISLEDWLGNNGGKMDLFRAIALVSRLGQALSYAHDQGIIHRDVKPANILVNDDDLLKLTDFNLAKPEQTDNNLTSSGIGMGTPEYASPEQYRNAKAVGEPTDVYGLGMVFYRILSGKLPFLGKKAMDMYLSKVKGEYIPLTDLVPDLPPQIAALIDTMIKPEPEDRFPTIDAFLKELRLAAPRKRPTS